MQTFMSILSPPLSFQLVVLESLGFKLDNDLKLKQFKHTKLFHNTDNIVFIILYNHYLPKISKLKNQVLKLKFKI
jgi:hypothetical protein